VAFQEVIPYSQEILKDQLLPHTLTRLWQQLEYHMDVCRVTRGAHIEQL